MAENIPFNLPPGRIVSGRPDYKQDKDMQGKVKEHPNWFMAVAVPKTAPGVLDVINLMVNVARQQYQGYPAIVQRINLGLKGGFRWKIEDGDDPEDPKNRAREGWAGSWIFKFSTTLGVMKCCNAQNQPIDPATVKTGHWVDVSGTVSINENTDHTAGIYINPGWVRFQWYGAEIQSGPSPDQAFASAPPPTNMPAGASATPITAAGPAGAGAGPGFGGGTGFTPQTTGGGFGNAPAPGFGGGAQPGPGFSGGAAPQGQPQGGFNPNQPQPGFNPNQPQVGFNPNAQPAAPTAAQVAAQYGVQHHEGWRWDPNSRQYVQDVPPAAGPGVQAGATGFPAPATAATGFPGTASPSNIYPGATPQHGFAQGQVAH